MLGLTNILVRFLVQDDQAQFERAQKIIGRESRTGSGVLISLLVLLETEWVLRSRYSLTKTEILAAFSGLLASAELRFEDEHSIESALFAWKTRPPISRIASSAPDIAPLDVTLPLPSARKRPSCPDLSQPDCRNTVLENHLTPNARR